MMGKLGNALGRPHVLALLLTIIVLVSFKVPDLGLPFYWDEAWVYAPAVEAMGQHGPSLLPGSIPPELSRGHPLLFHALAATWSLVFGSSPVPLHAFAMLVSVLLLVSIHGVGVSIGLPRAGSAAAMMVCALEPFLAQSGLLLPEVMLALWCTLALLGYVQGERRILVPALVLAMWTKESAVVLAVAMLVWTWSRTPTPGKPAVGTWPILLSIALAGTFFLVQRFVSGWFLYPEHVDMLAPDPVRVNYLLKHLFSTVFEDQGMYVVLYAFAFGGTLLWFRKDLYRALAVMVLYIAGIKFLWGRWMPDELWGTLLAVLCLGALIPLFFRPIHRSAPRLGDLLGIGFLFVGAFFVFSAVNFYTDRYLIVVLPFVALGTMALADHLLQRMGWWAFGGYAVLVVAVLLFHLPTDDRVSDVRLAYGDGVRVHLDLVRHLEAEGLQDTPIRGSYMDIVYLTRPGAGYLKGRPFTRMVPYEGSATDLVIVSNEDPDHEDHLERLQVHEVVFRASSGPAWIELLRTSGLGAAEDTVQQAEPPLVH